MDDSLLLANLRARFNAGEPMKFVCFWGHHPGRHGIDASCFSQWFDAPFELDGLRYRTAEHYMMAEKARLFGDEDIRTRVLNAGTPGEAKALGRQVSGFDEALWRLHRFDIVVRANAAKFGQHSTLQQFLLNTGHRILVEASPVDRIWGIGLARDHPQAHNPNAWEGLNLLGFALMRVRDSRL